MPRPRPTLSLLALALIGALLVLSGAGGSDPDVAEAGRPGDGREDRGREEVIPGAYIVTFNRTAGSPGSETESRERRQGFEAEYVYRRALEGFSAELSPRQVDQLEADPEVASVTPDRKVRAVADLVSTEPTPPPGVRRIGAATTTSARSASGVNVAVIDTGVDLDHPDLNAASGRNCVDPAAPADDDNGHGTHVAGTIAGENDGSGVVGVAPGTKVYAAKVLAGNGSGTASQVICGIDWVTSTRTDSDPSNDIAVANMSLGGPGTPVGSCATTTDPEHRAICASTAAGVSYVVAAGNEGWDFDYASEPDTPAAYPEALTVTAMGDSDGEPGGSGGAPVCQTGEADDRYASFSSFAATAAGSAHTIAAPGVCIRSTVPGGNYATMSGTSMASPHVAGAVALCLEEGGEAGPCAGLSPGQIVEKMRADAASRTAASGGSSFEGDPGRPFSGRYFGHLAWVSPADLDSDPPGVASVSPAGGTTGVATTTSVSVSFSEPMDRAETEAAFSLVRSSDGVRVSGSFSWSANTMTFRPAAALSQGAGYTAGLSTSARDLAGNPLAAARSWGFKTLTTVTARPSATVIESGTLRGGNYARLAADDNSVFAVNSTPTGTRVSSWYGRFTSVDNALRGLTLTYRGNNSAQCTQTVAAYRWTTRTWVTLDSRAVGATEVQVNKTPAGALADYVSGSTGAGEVRLRVRCTRTASAFNARGDLMRVVYTRP